MSAVETFHHDLRPLTERIKVGTLYTLAHDKYSTWKVKWIDHWALEAVVDTERLMVLRFGEDYIIFSILGGTATDERVGTYLGVLDLEAYISGQLENARYEESMGDEL